MQIFDKAQEFGADAAPLLFEQGVRRQQIAFRNFLRRGAEIEAVVAQV